MAQILPILKTIFRVIMVIYIIYQVSTISLNDDNVKMLVLAETARSIQLQVSSNNGVLCTKNTPFWKALVIEPCD